MTTIMKTKTPLTTAFGSCRIDMVSNQTNLNNIISYTHSTKEVIQLINVLSGKLIIPHPYNKLCFRTGILENKPIYCTDLHKQLFSKSDVFLIEICSRKNYIHSDYYLHHLCVDKRFKYICAPLEIFENYRMEIQTDKEIETDIEEIQRLLFPRKIIIVSHYNSKINGKYIPLRNSLINLLQKICSNNDIPFVNPTEVLKNYRQHEIMTRDLGHYTDWGKPILKQFLDECIKQCFQRTKNEMVT